MRPKDGGGLTFLLRRRLLKSGPTATVPLLYGYRGGRSAVLTKGARKRANGFVLLLPSTVPAVGQGPPPLHRSEV